MSMWKNIDLKRIGDAQELTIQPRRDDGSLRAPLPIWVVRDGDELFIRSYKGDAGAWYRAAKSSLAGHVEAGGVESDVEFSVEHDESLNDRIDTAYRTKYAAYGDAYVGPMVSPTARATTLKLTPC